jgi:predicted DNA-binding transcriptional regulator YafY
MWLDQEIREHKYPNCRTLAAHFEISLRQANRDMEYLKNTLNAPVRYIAAKRGFTYEDMTFILPNLILTSEDKMTLNFLAHRYDNYDGTMNNQRIAKLFKSLSGTGKDQVQTPVFPIDEEQITSFHRINRCIENRRKLEVSYIVPGDGLQKLLLHPYQLYGKADNDYLIAYCEEYSNIAVFRLDRIVRCIDTNHRFIVKDEYKQDSYSSFLMKKPFKARILIEKPDLAKGILGDKLTQLEDKLYEAEFYDIEQFIRDLMISNCWTKIISPDWLKEKLRNRCEKIMNKIKEK